MILNAMGWLCMYCLFWPSLHRKKIKKENFSVFAYILRDLGLKLGKLKMFSFYFFIFFVQTWELGSLLAQLAELIILIGRSCRLPRGLRDLPISILRTISCANNANRLPSSFVQKKKTFPVLAWIGRFTNSDFGVIDLGKNWRCCWR